MNTTRDATINPAIAGPGAPVGAAKSRNRIIALLAIGILLNGLFNNMVLSKNGLKPPLEPGSKLPDFSLKLTDGQEVSNRNLVGKKAVYFFFANWCPCSHLSARFVKQLFDENGAGGLAVLGVGMQDTPEHIEAFQKKHGLGFPVGNKGGDAMAEGVGIRTTPALVFVDERGVIRFYFLGKIEKYEQVLEGLRRLEGKPPKPVSG